MKIKNALTTTLVTAVATLSLASPLVARADSRCTDLVKECFVYSGEERDTCFKTVTTHQFCSGSPTAALAAKRWGLSPLLPSGVDAAPAFLGPQLIDQACLANFDNSWSSALVNGSISDESMKKLTGILESCARVPASEVVRP